MALVQQACWRLFLSHPKTQKAKINIIDHHHPSTEELPKVWERVDEWYNFKSITDSLNFLANLDEASYEGGTNGSKHPIAWYHSFEGGRDFYTGLGHNAFSSNGYSPMDERPGCRYLMHREAQQIQNDLRGKIYESTRSSMELTLSLKATCFQNIKPIQNRKYILWVA